MEYELGYKTNPYDHQKMVEKIVIERFNSGMNYQALFMEMGTGKTKVTIDLATFLNKYRDLEAVLLIAPNGIQEQWYKEQVPEHSYLNYKRLLWNNAKTCSYMSALESFITEDAEECVEFKVMPKKTRDSRSIKVVESNYIQGKDDNNCVLDEGEFFYRFKTEEELKEETEDFFSELTKEDVDSAFEPIVAETLQDIAPDIPLRDKQTSNKSKSTLKWFFVNGERFSVGDEHTFKPFIDFVKTHKTLVIVDEGTIIKNPTSKRTKNITALGRHADYRMLLTGTPVTNSPFDTYSMMEFLKPGFWECNYFVFKNRYGMFIKDSAPNGRSFSREMSLKDISVIKKYLERGVEPEDIGPMIGTSQKTIEYIRDNPDVIRPYKNLDKIRAKIRPYSIVLKKKDCKDINIPDKIYKVETLEMPDEQMRVYKELRKHLIAEYCDKELTALNAVSLQIRLQQITGGFFPYIEEEIEDNEEGLKLIKSKKILPIGAKNVKIEYLKQNILEAGDLKIIIWARFVPEIELIYTALFKAFPNKEIEKYYGGTPIAERNEIKEEFSKGLIDILIINPQTGSRGLNLQVATLHYYYSNHRSLEMREQSEDRSHRIGQDKAVQYVDILFKNTIDVTILNSLKLKKDLLEYFREGKLEDLI